MVIKTNDPERNHSKQKSKAVKAPPIKIETKPSPTEAAKSENKKDETQGGMMRFDESKAMSESPKALTAEQLFSHKPADQEKTSTSKSPEPVMMSDKEEAKPALSYAEQISMFLRGKQIQNTSFRESTEEKINSSSDISDRSTPLETKSSEDSPELKPNKVVPNLKPSENIANTDTLSEMWHQDQKSTHEPTPFPIPSKTAATELSPLKTSLCQATNNNNNSSKSVESLKASNFVPEDKCDSGVSSNKIGSGRKNIIRVLTPQSINEKYETEKTVSTSSIKSSRPLNILHQNPIKKVKLKNGKVLHIFINKNSKISKQPTLAKVEQNADKAAFEAPNLHSKDGVEDPIILKGTGGNLGDPLHVDKDTPALQVPDPDEMDVDDKKPHDQSVDKDFEVTDKMEPESSISVDVTDQMDIETELIQKETPGDINDTLNDNADSSDTESSTNEEFEKLNHKADERCMETSEAITDRGDPDTETGLDDKREEVYGTDTEKFILEADSSEGEVETEMIVDSSQTTEGGCKNPEEEIKETEEEDGINSSNKSETPEISSINNEEVTFSAGDVAVASEQDSFIEGNVSEDGDTYEISTPRKTPESTQDDSGFSDVELSDVSSVSVSSDLSPAKQNDFEKSTTELISRLATKTKEMLLPQISKSPVKDENGHGSVETIEKSEEFTQMMRRITDNMAALNGEQSAVSASSWNTRLRLDNEELESNGEGMGGGLLSENELDLVVEDIWSEKFS